MPVSLGSKCVFKFVLPQKIIGSDTLRVNLSNVRRTISGTGENRSVKHSILWCCVKEIPLKNVRVISGKMEGEVEITIPYDCFEHDKSDPKNMVFWQLQISAETPEIDFAADFPIPVFKTEKSDPAVYGSAEDEKEVLAGEPKIKGIQFQQIPEGLRLFIKPFRFISSAISTFLLGSLFAGVGIGMCIYGIWFGIIFAIIGFFNFSFQYSLSSHTNRDCFF